jgi:hypothetical protein
VTQLCLFDVVEPAVPTLTRRCRHR